MDSSPVSRDDSGSDDITPLQKIEQSNYFQGTVITMVLVNTYLLGREAEEPMKSHQAGAPSPEAFWWLDQAFLVFFTCEITFRLLAYRCKFFCNKDWSWNAFDLTIVGLGVLDQWLFGMILTQKQRSGGISKCIMILRVLRVLRVLRAFRLFKQFKKLKILASGLIDSIQSVIWVGVLLFLVIFVYAIIITKLAGKNWKDFPEEDQDVVRDKFGTIPKAMETLFIFLTCDDWSTPARIINKQMPFMQIVWVTYIVIGVFTLLSLLTGLMAERMNQVRQQEEENENARKAKELDTFMDDLKIMFEKADTSGDCKVDAGEFQDMMCTKKYAKKLQECGVPVMKPEETGEVFEAMDREFKGQLGWEEFRDGLVQLSRPFTAKDVMWLESSVIQLDKMLVKHDASGNCIDWDHRIDRVHAHARLISERLALLEMNLKQFFTRVGYQPT